MLQAVASGDGWLAAATSERHIRLFTIGGVQKEILSLPGPVVAMAGHTNQLLVVYHTGLGTQLFVEFSMGQIFGPSVEMLKPCNEVCMEHKAVVGRNARILK